jgi:hypothetical protein
MHDRFRGEQEHHQSGDGQRAHGQCRTIEQHAQKHDANHDERALGRHLIAGQNEIKAGNEKRGERGPFLDRRAVGKAGDQGEEGADDEKYQSGHHCHVIAGNRQHVTDAGNKQRVINVWCDRITPAIDQHCGNGAVVAG